MPSLDSILAPYPRDKGISLISEGRPFLHPEDEYDSQYQIDQLTHESMLREAQAVLDRCMERGFDPALPVLEIGCGTGRLSVGLAQEPRIKEFLATDPSSEFCAITKSKLDALPKADHCRVGLLRAEDLRLLPAGALSLIILKSTLHHILDVSSFVETCSEKLAPNGLLVFEEPCHEGYVLMGAITQFIPVVLRSKGIELKDGWAEDVQRMTATMQFYARRDVDKSQLEDKHLFRADELMRIGANCGLDLEVFPNRTLPELGQPGANQPPDYLHNFFCNYLQFCMSWDEELVALVREHMAGYFTYFEPLSKEDALPHCYGSFIYTKTR